MVELALAITILPALVGTVVVVTVELEKLLVAAVVAVVVCQAVAVVPREQTVEPGKPAAMARLAR